MNCIVYGLVFIVFGLVSATLLDLEFSVMPFETFQQPEQLFLFLIPVAGLMLYSLRYREVRTCSFRSEILVAAAAILGLSMPLTALGLFLLLITIPDYDGVEKWLPDIKDRSHYELSELQRVIAELDLSEDVKTSTEQLIERSRDRDLIAGRSFGSLLGGIIYVVARENKEPRTLDEISEAVREDKRDVGKAYRYVARELDLRILPPQPEQFVERFAAKLGLSEEVAIHAKEIIEKAKKKDIISGKSSKGIAAAAVYVSAHIEGEDRSLNEMSDILHITTVTIRERGKDLVQKLELEEAPENLKQ